MSDINYVNISLLKSYKDDFNSKKNDFNNNSYNVFSSSYINKCSDPYVLQMKNSLNVLYLDIKSGYTNINNWWSRYNSDVESIENKLSFSNGSKLTTISSVNSIVNALPELDDYSTGLAQFKLTGTAISSFITSKENESDEDDGFFGTMKNVAAIAIDGVQSAWNRATDWVTDEAIPVIEEVGSTVVDGAKTAWNAATDWVTNEAIPTIEEVGSTIVDGAKSAWDRATDWVTNEAIPTIENAVTEVKNWWTDDVVPWAVDAASKVMNVVERVGATVSTAAFSLVEGLMKLGESLEDLVVIIGTAGASIFTGLFDAGQALGSLITGGEWESVTKKMWNETKGFVSNDYVGELFDLFYEETAYGQWMSQNAYGFDTVRKISSGIGYIAGIVAITVATCGAGSAVVTVGGTTAEGTAAAITVGSAATTVTGATATVTTSALFSGTLAATAGIGKNTEEAWNDGASILQGLLYGGAMGVWEGLEMTLGYSINALRLFKGTGTASTVANSLSHVIFDTIDGATSTGTSSFLQMIYASNSDNIDEIMYLVNYDSNGNQISNKEWDDLSITEKWNALFEYNGGWASVATNAISAGAISFLSELPDVFKAVKTASATTGAATKAATSSTGSKTVSLDDSLPLLSTKSGITMITNSDFNYYVKKYSQLLNSDSRLNYIIQMRNNGYSIQIPSDLVASYQTLSVLENVIKRGNITAPEMIELNKMGITKTSLSNITTGNGLFDFYKCESFVKKLEINGYNSNSIVTDLLYSSIGTDKKLQRSISDYCFNYLVYKKGYSEIDSANMLNIINDNIINSRGMTNIYSSGNVSYNIINNFNVKNQIYKINDVVNSFEKLPQSLKNSVQEVNIYDCYNPADYYWHVNYGNPYGGYFESAATGGNKQINIWAASSDRSLWTISHEAGHNFMSTLSQNAVDEYRRAVDADYLLTGRYSVSEYGETNIGEDFAESVASYVDYLMKNNEYNIMGALPIEKFKNRMAWMRIYVK